MNTLESNRVEEGSNSLETEGLNVPLSATLPASKSAGSSELELLLAQHTLSIKNAPIDTNSLASVVKYLSEHPENAPPELVFALAEHLLIDSANEASIKSRAEFGSYLEQNQVAFLFLSNYIDRYAMATGQRFVPDVDIHKATAEALVADRLEMDRPKLTRIWEVLRGKKPQRTTAISDRMTELYGAKIALENSCRELRAMKDLIEAGIETSKIRAETEKLKQQEQLLTLSAKSRLEIEQQSRETKNELANERKGLLAEIAALRREKESLTQQTHALQEEIQDLELRMSLRKNILRHDIGVLESKKSAEMTRAQGDTHLSIAFQEASANLLSHFELMISEAHAGKMKMRLHVFLDRMQPAHSFRESFMGLSDVFHTIEKLSEFESKFGIERRAEFGKKLHALIRQEVSSEWFQSEECYQALFNAMTSRECPITQVADIVEAHKSQIEKGALERYDHFQAKGAPELVLAVRELSKSLKDSLPDLFIVQKRKLY